MDFDALVVIGGIIYFLYRLFGGKNEKKDAQVAPAVPAAEKKSLKERIEQAVQDIEQRVEASSSPEATTDHVAKSSHIAKPQLEQHPSPVSAETSDDVYAFHSASNQIKRERETPQIDWSEYNALINEDADDQNTDDEYYSQGFSGFHMAGAISHSGDHTGDDIHEDIYDREHSKARHPLFASRADIRRAIIAQEILGKPKSLQRR